MTFCLGSTNAVVRTNCFGNGDVAHPGSKVEVPRHIEETYIIVPYKLHFAF